MEMVRSLFKTMKGLLQVVYRRQEQRYMKENDLITKSYIQSIINYLPPIKIIKMLKNSCLTQDQIHETIIKHLFGQINLELFIKSKIQNNCNITRESILVALCKKIQEFFLQLEKSLLMAQKIKQLRIYDHDSLSLFEPILINLKSIITESCRQEFFHLYKNINLNWIQIIWQIQYTFIHTQKKLQIYNSFIDFAQREDLFKKVRLQQKDPTQGCFPYESVLKVFPPRDLQLILKTFRQTKMDVIKTYRRLQYLQLNGPEYKEQKQFIVRFDNLLLIGLYSAYKQYCILKEKQYDSWNKFIVRKFKNVNFEPHLQTLLRICVRNDPKLEELQKINELITSKVTIKPKELQILNIEKKKIDQITKNKYLNMEEFQEKPKKKVKISQK